MLRMARAFAFLILCFLGFSGALADESVELPLAVSLPTHHLKSVSSSVLEAETWLRIHVLSHYPSSRISHIAVGHNVPCSHPQFNLLLPCLKNLYFSLTRWGLQNEINLSLSISPLCLNHKLSKPLLDFSEAHGLKKLESFVILHGQNSRKLSSLLVDPYPARPSPLPELSPSSSSQIHISYPANIAKSPLPPLIGSASPIESPVFYPAPPPFNLPPCNPSPAPAPATEFGEEKLWCVAKPSVPVETLQEGIDFACGEGGADCGEIQPDGSCYNPDTVIAHASYAYNSYWQKNKGLGGSCGFDGTAMIINADPSFMNCRFGVS